MLLREIIPLHFEDHKKPINTFCGKTAEMLSV
jgi:hypothetical protein